LADQVKALPNVDINTINRVMKVTLTEMGKPPYTDFESNRNAIVQEINTGLSGSAVGSDFRVQIELDNLKSARSPRQIVGAIGNLTEAVISRLDASLSPIYPLSVVQGKETMGRYRERLFKRYRGSYQKHLWTLGEDPGVASGEVSDIGGSGVWVFKNGQWVKE
jgi:hypothetical protein